MKATNRPIFLNLWRIKFPVTAIVSILHRISGILIFLGLPLLLYLLRQSLSSQASFDQLIAALSNPLLKLTLWIIAVSIFVHLIAGIRHLLMDAGIGESLRGGRTSAWMVLIMAFIVAILLGIWLWS